LYQGFKIGAVIIVEQPPPPNERTKDVYEYNCEKYPIPGFRKYPHTILTKLKKIPVQPLRLIF
jgi:hypothetical protein